MAMADLDTMLAPTTILIEGEPLDSPYAEDAQQWVGIYSELVSFTGRALARQQAQPYSSAEPEWLNAGDAAQLRSHLDRLLSRLEFWRRRVHDLAGLELDLESRTIAYQGRTAPLTRRALGSALRSPTRGDGRMTAERVRGKGVGHTKL